MNSVDLLILVWAASSAYRGYSIGFIRHILSFAGFFVGLLLGGWLAPFIGKLFQSQTESLIASLVLTLILAIILAGVADRLAFRLQKSHNWKPAHLLNNTLGIFSGTAFVLIAAWLIASVMTRLPAAGIALTVEQSKTVQVMNRIMPPAPNVMDRIGQLFSPNGLPQVFVGSEPDVGSVGPPSTPEVEAAASKARDSVVRVEGFACGNISTGTGFVVGRRYVATNAHVVAGVQNPVLLDKNGRVRAQVVLFDQDQDFAILRTERSLTGRPLTLASESSKKGDSVAVIGYPGGGTLKVSPGVVFRSQLALGRDIYDEGVVTREIYAMEANVIPGNSGGPVVLPDGSVAGVIFGSSPNRAGVGYALTARAISDNLEKGLQSTNRVSSGPCIKAP